MGGEVGGFEEFFSQRPHPIIVNFRKIGSKDRRKDFWDHCSE